LNGRLFHQFASVSGGHYSPILPPPRRVTTTTDGRGGMSARKSGQRVAGF